MKRASVGLLAILLFLGVLFSVAGCRSDQPESGPADETTGSAETPTSEEPVEPAPTEDDLYVLLTESAQAWTESLMSGAGTPYEVTAQITQDASGSWWGIATVQPTAGDGNAYESVIYWCAYDGLEWTGQAQDPEPPSPDTYFPSDVVEVLF
jgi:hypothetical protein